MVPGYMNRILRINLSKGKISSEKLDEDALRSFIGGGGVATKILYDELPAGYDSFDEENPLIFMTGPLTGTAIRGAALCVVVSKSPLTGFTVGRSRMQGFFGPELKFAGYDGIVIKGKASTPVFLWIHNEEVEIMDASKIWGMDVHKTENCLREDFSDPRIRISSIGPAGEVVVRSACIVSEKYHVAGRGGLGAVMGSKKLKAIAVRGKRRVPVADKKSILQITKEWQKLCLENHGAVGLSKWGTSGDTQHCESRHAIGDLPSKNLTTGVFKEWNNLSGEYMIKKFPTSKKPAQCFNCPIGHDRLIKISGGDHFNVYAFPEYEDTAAWGSNLGITDTISVIKLTDAANRYGIDSVEASFTISLAMECYEKGLITEDNTGGIDLRWGNADAVFELLEKIVRRDGIGDLLAEGVKRAADKLGAADYAVHIKNMAPMQHDIRSDWGLLLGYTVAGAGPVHEGVAKWLLPDQELGFPKPLPRFATQKKAEAVMKTQLKRLLSDNLGICSFVSRTVPQRLVAKALSAATGWDISLKEAYEVSERTVTLTRAFNIRHGLKPSDDWPSPRLLEPPKDGGSKGITAEPYLAGMVREYYRLMGWDEITGKPLRNTLTRLGLADVVKDIW